ncbi:MAG TPA: hypothetical protein VKW06_02890 [Candidatus Angelobacter sp.]|nr:hypothetical protein [Candidatus Angelobacter sp.]
MDGILVKLLVLGVGLSLLCYAWVVLVLRNVLKSASRNPRAILRRSKRQLKLVRRDLDKIPASREVHNLYGEIVDTERDIEQTDTWFRHAAGK